MFGIFNRRPTPQDIASDVIKVASEKALLADLCKTLRIDASDHMKALVGVLIFSWWSAAFKLSRRYKSSLQQVCTDAASIIADRFGEHDSFARIEDYAVSRYEQASLPFVLERDFQQRVSRGSTSQEIHLPTLVRALMLIRAERYFQAAARTTREDVFFMSLAVTFYEQITGVDAVLLVSDPLRAYAAAPSLHTYFSRVVAHFKPKFAQ